MVSKEKFYKLASSKIVFEAIDHDTLIINLDTGYYYSLENSASMIWNMLVHGASERDVIEFFSTQAEVVESDFVVDLTKFINSLVDENLVLVAQTGNDWRSKEIGSFKSNYVAPAMRKFTDMEALLLADPIHEFVDEDR